MKSVPRTADGAVVGLAIAFFVLAGSQNDPRPLPQYGLILLLPLALVATAVTGRAWIAAASLVILGVVVRAVNLDHGFFGSDVLPVTREAIDRVLDGKNPYGYEFAASRNPFAYPPGNLLYYLPGFLLSDIRGTEIASAAIVLAGFGWAAWLVRDDGPIVAMAVYAVAPPFLLIATDGSNDTSAGALLFVSVLCLLVAKRRSNGALLVTSALLMGETLAFKQYTLPFWPFLVAYVASQQWELSLGRGSDRGMGIPAWNLYAVVSLGFAGLISLPFFIWSPDAFIGDLLAWSDAAIHPITGWNVWSFLLRWQGWNAETELGDGLAFMDMTLMGAAILLGLVSGVKRPSQALIFGAATWFVVMLFARWTTFAYFAGVAPVVLLIPFADRLVEAPEEVEKMRAASGVGLPASPLPQE